MRGRSAVARRTTEEARAIANWKPPRLPVSGGSLIARGLVEGPVVARTLRQIEHRWVEAGFPAGDALETIVQQIACGSEVGLSPAQHREHRVWAISWCTRRAALVPAIFGRGALGPLTAAEIV